MRGAWIAGCLALMSQCVMAAPLPVVQPGASIDAGQWRVKPMRARLTTEYPLRRPLKESKQYLLVELELTNLMERSSHDYRFVVGVLPQLGEPAFVLMRDMELPDRLHPDMPEVMMLIWPWPDGTPAPQELQLSITGKTFKKADNLVGAPGWFYPKVVATATLPLISP